MKWTGIDIGGAYLKLADGRGFADAFHFALWENPHRLAMELRTLVAHAPSSDHLAVTMTGELADCFETKAEGVRFIIEAVREAADGRHTRVYLRNGMLVTPQVAVSRPADVAAANWHALARFAARYAVHETALVIDVGSTTCDIIPLQDGEPAALGRTDTERLLAGELVYSGVERSPVCAVTDRVTYRGEQYPVAAEVFATMRDVNIILGELREDTAARLTADGRPGTKSAARARLARMICADSATFNHRDAVILSQAVADAQAGRVASAIQRVVSQMPSPPAVCIVSGHGEFLVRRALDETMISPRIISLSEKLGAKVSRCAPAHALAILAREAANGVRS
ncbi:MAG: hydantoinase/oxoprolinase family protein [Pirellulaceae bacterium]